MRTLQKIISDPHELCAWFPSQMRAGFVFLPGVTSVQVGEELCVWIKVPSYRAEVYLTGVVAWRRLKRSEHAPAMGPGSGLALRPPQQAEIAFLGRLIIGAVQPLPERHFARTRILVPWSCAVMLPRVGRWCPASLMEISPGGARVELPALPVRQGCAVDVTLPWHSQASHRMHLAWHRATGGHVQLGLTRRLDGSLHEREWDSLVEAASRHFCSQVISF